MTDNKLFPNPKQKNILIVFLVTGVFFIGAAMVMFFLPKAQEQVLANNYSVIPVNVNYPAPEIRLTDMANNPVLLRDYRGKVVLVNNWATWCPPCEAEMPILEKYYESHLNQDFIIIAIDSGERAEEVAKFVAQYKLTFPIWLDLNSLALDAFENWDLPSSYVIDKDGIIRLIWTGGVSLAKLENYITPLLEK